MSFGWVGRSTTKKIDPLTYPLEGKSPLGSFGKRDLYTPEDTRIAPGRQAPSRADLRNAGRQRPSPPVGTRPAGVSHRLAAAGQRLAGVICGLAGTGDPSADTGQSTLKTGQPTFPSSLPCRLTLFRTLGRASQAPTDKPLLGRVVHLFGPRDRLFGPEPPFVRTSGRFVRTS